MIAAGDLCHRITIETKPSGRSSIGGEVAADPDAVWPTFATVWAEVKPLQGREAERAKQIVAECTYQVRIRYLAGVNETQRLDFKGRKLYILSAINTDEANVELVLLCNERK